MIESKPKVVVITGCSSGIGFASAVEFSKNNFITFPTMRNLRNKNELEYELNNSENIIQLDVTSDTSIDNAIDEIENKYGRIDILINNAGYVLLGSFEDTSIEEFKQQLETNFFGTIRMLKKVIPIMKKNNSGKIINISSVAGLTGFPFMPAYVSSSFALEGLTESLRYELKKFNIQSCLIEIGGVRTKFIDNKILSKNALNNQMYSKSIENYLNMFENIIKNSTPSDIVAKKIVEFSNLDILDPRYIVGEDTQQIMSQKNLLTPLEYEKYILNFMLKDIIE
ncbi:MAG: short-chain dehydrogenase/reductase [Thaumarchaeota archaeon]|jgi:short-subunit dehydrogenase|nr:MAG: short-chain dehydrogenase/reductase [Nitrososphaerota archaeon]